MNILEIKEGLQKYNIYLNDIEIAQLWGMDKGYFSRKKKNGTQVKQSLVELLEQKYNIKLTGITNVDNKETLMNVAELEKTLKKAGIDLSSSAMAEIMGVTEQDYSEKKKSGSEIKYQDIVKIEKALDISLTDLTSFFRTQEPTIVKTGTCPYRMEHNCPCQEQVEIKYLEILPDEAKLKEITSVHVDVELVKNHWHRLPENLRIIPMQGDTLAGYTYPIYNRDVLMIDINSIVPTREGLYAYSAQNNSLFFVAKLVQDIEGNIEITKYNENGEVSEIISPEKQKEVDFKILGRVVKNCSWCL